MEKFYNCPVWLKFLNEVFMNDKNLIDYVIVHELSHIVEFNHSKTFWKIVESVIPNYKQERILLKQGDFLLNLFR